MPFQPLQDEDERLDLERISDDGDEYDNSYVVDSKDAMEVDTERYPKSIYFIMGNEFCERFSYYGMRAVLAVYLADFLGFSENSAVSSMHLFTMAAYFTPLLGAVLSDAYLGKYKTILYLSVVYTFGLVILSVCSVPGVMPGDPPAYWGALLGLLLISVGTGGIKPCVSSFVGDQFVVGQEALLASVFSLFYFFINSGSVLSTLITPLLARVGYAFAFGLPAVLLVAATGLFFFGRKSYRMVPPGDNVLASFAHVVAVAARGWWASRPSCAQWASQCAASCSLPRALRRWRGAESAQDREAERREAERIDFLDHALGECDASLVADIKATVRVFTVFVPLPIFWSIYDQSSSRWVFQARAMDRNVFGFEIAESQVPTLNPVLILLLIPLFEKYFYPLFARYFYEPKPLEHRMVWGMTLTAVAITLAGLLQVYVAAYPGQVFIAWQLPQWIVLSAAEIMVSITGLEFAYSQSPKSMKSIVMAGWLLTVSVGNLLVAAIAESDFISELAYQFFFFAALMLVFVGFFYWLIADFEYQNFFNEADEGLQSGSSDDDDGDVHEHVAASIFADDDDIDDDSMLIELQDR
jgi:solute carrier family 15 (oligopeptide transporter), member 1